MAAFQIDNHFWLLTYLYYRAIILPTVKLGFRSATIISSNDSEVESKLRSIHQILC
jgi:hypothetical protein